MAEELNRELTELLRQTDAAGKALWITTDKRVNAPILAEHVIDELGLYKSSEGIFDLFGNRYTDSDLEKVLREKVMLHLPEVSGSVIKNSALPALLDRIPAKAIEIQNAGVGTYIKNRMKAEINAFARAGNISTGFSKLDEKSGGLFPGLYVIGATSSLGKTTFVHQLADNIAAAGRHVLYFSLEMSFLELVSKSIARMSAHIDSGNALTSLKLRNGITNRLSEQAETMYISAVEDRLNIIEGNFDTTVSYIGEYAQRYIETHKEAPVIFIDYLQIIQGAPKGTAKDAVDYNMTELKRLSRALKTPIIVVSSVNRAGYLLPVDFESFKESGSIEFSADVVLGMQLSCLDEPLFAKDKAITEKRERVRKARDETPRKISLVCLKNRYGRTGWGIDYDYYPANDLFIENKGWTEVNTKTPFDKEEVVYIGTKNRQAGRK